MLFGMYEAYITKVLWSPTWNPDVFKIAEVAVIETTLLVFLWHAVFSFITPLFIGEYLLTSSNRLHISLPIKWRSRISQYKSVIIFGLIASILIGTTVPNIEDGIGITLFNLLAVTASILSWRLFTRKKRYDLVDLLPRKGELVILDVILLVVYLNFGFNLNRHVHPGFIGHAAILILYTVIILLTIRSLHKDKKELPFNSIAENESLPSLRLKHWFIFCGTLLLGVILLNILRQDFQDLFARTMFIVYVALGILFFVFSVKNLFTKSKASANHFS